MTWDEEFAGGGRGPSRAGGEAAAEAATAADAGGERPGEWSAGGSPPGFGAIGEEWADSDGAAVPVLVGAAVTALSAGGFAVSAGLGANVLVIALAVAGTALVGAWGQRRWRSGWGVVWGTAAVGLAALPLWRDDGWFQPVLLGGAVLAGTLALGGGRTWDRIVTRPLAYAVRVPRALVWMREGAWQVGVGRRVPTAALARAAAVTVGVTVVFAALFAAADAVFAQLLTALAPDVGVSDVVLRLILGFLGAVAAAGAAYFARTSADASTSAAAEPTRLRIPRIPVRGRVEWLVPLVVLDVLCALFAAVQGVVLFGGNAGLLDAADTTRAEYARAGFWQLFWATLLTLGVIALTLHTVPRDRPAERRLATRLVAVLAVCALVIGAASLYRTRAYVRDFGLDRPRLVMGGVELWLCAVLVLVVLGLAWRAVGRVLARVVVASGLATFAVLGALSPDGVIADQRVDLFARTGRIDVAYLQGLGADAVPALDRLPEPYRSCALLDIAERLDGDRRPWYATSIARERALRILADRPVDPEVRSTCAWTLRDARPGGGA